MVITDNRAHSVARQLVKRQLNNSMAAQTSWVVISGQQSHPIVPVDILLATHQHGRHDFGCKRDSEVKHFIAMKGKKM